MNDCPHEAGKGKENMTAKTKDKAAILAELFHQTQLAKIAADNIARLEESLKGLDTPGAYAEGE